MANLSPEQVYQLARGAGFDRDEAVVMTAIAKYESNFNPDAHNDQGRDDSYGLWQINMLNRLGPARREALGLESNDELFDPETNARAAHHVFSGQGYDAWSVYKNGRYEEFMDEAQAARAGIESSEAGSTEPEAGSGREGDAPEVTDPQQEASADGHPELRRGDTGQWVTYLQEQLEAIGVTPNGIDGDFGRKTSLAVRRFQAAMGAGQPTGVVDAQTWQWIAACRVQGWIADAAETFGIADDIEDAFDTELSPGLAGPTAQQLIDVASQQVGDRYVFGHEVDLEDEDPSTFDCSELIQWATHQLGVSFPTARGTRSARSPRPASNGP